MFVLIKIELKLDKNENKAMNSSDSIDWDSLPIDLFNNEYLEPGIYDNLVSLLLIF